LSIKQDFLVEFEFQIIGLWKKPCGCNSSD